MKTKCKHYEKQLMYGMVVHTVLENINLTRTTTETMPQSGRCNGCANEEVCAHKPLGYLTD